jgi:hypothetical protein
MRPLRLVAAASSSLVLALAAAPARGGDDAGPSSVTSPAPADEPPAVPDAGPAATPVSGPSRWRRWGSLGGVAGVYASTATLMYFAWYHGQPDLPSLKVGGDGWFGEDTYAGGADKVGHAWASLAMSRLSSEILVWGGWAPWKAGLLGSGMTLGLFTLFEVKDGFYTELSPGDALFNAVGAGLNVAMLAYPPLDELIDFRVEYLPSRDYRDLLDGQRPPPDPAAPRQVSLNFVEDYSGQRFLLALHLGALPGLRGRTWAKLVDVAAGFESDRYKPEPVAPGRRRLQHLFLGVSINLQGLVDLALADRRHPLARKARAFGHLLFELVNPPYGSAAVVGAERSPDG